jgi:hypothetical protein
VHTAESLELAMKTDRDDREPVAVPGRATKMEAIPGRLMLSSYWLLRHRRSHGMSELRLLFMQTTAKYWNHCSREGHGMNPASRQVPTSGFHAQGGYILTRARGWLECRLNPLIR